MLYCWIKWWLIYINRWIMVHCCRYYSSTNKQTYTLKNTLLLLDNTLRPVMCECCPVSAPFFRLDVELFRQCSIFWGFFPFYHDMQHYIGFKLFINNMRAFFSSNLSWRKQVTLWWNRDNTCYRTKNKEAYLWSGEALPIQVPIPFSTSMH